MITVKVHCVECGHEFHKAFAQPQHVNVILWRMKT